MVSSNLEKTIIDTNFHRLLEISAFVAVAAISVVAYLLEGAVSAPLLIVFGFSLAIIDTAFGMGYGTLATPALLIAGFHAIAVVPAVLLSQAVAAIFGTLLHVKYKNVDLFNMKGTDTRIAATIIAFGLIGVVAAVVFAIKLPSLYVKSYIGALTVAMGLLLIAKPKVRFSWSKLYAISIVNGFDKAISGGGSGPLAVGGLLTLGQKIRSSVGIAVFTVMVINLAGVAFYFLFHTIMPFEFYLMVTMSAGAMIGALVGPGITGHFNTKSHMNWLAYVVIVIGVITLLVTFKV